MLSHQQILHFRTFGYVTLRGLLTPAEAATLRQEVTGGLADAFGANAIRPGDLGGISGDYLPLAARRAPFSLALIADDPRTFASAAELLGRPAVPPVGIATRFTGDSPWHTRQGPDVGGVTFWAAFHAHLLNRAHGGAPRLSWTIDYLPWPGLGRPDQLRAVRDLILDDVEPGHEDYDRDRWPVWRDWAAGASRIPSRAIALERLKLLGVLTTEDGS